MCFERRFSKQNSIIRLKSNILPPPEFLGWLRHCSLAIAALNKLVHRNNCLMSDVVIVAEHPKSWQAWHGHNWHGLVTQFLKQTSVGDQSCLHGGIGGFTPQKSYKSPKLKCGTVWIRGFFVKFYNVSPTAQTQSPSWRPGDDSVGNEQRQGIPLCTCKWKRFNTITRPSAQVMMKTASKLFSTIPCFKHL